MEVGGDGGDDFSKNDTESVLDSTDDEGDDDNINTVVIEDEEKDVDKEMDEDVDDDDDDSDSEKEDAENDAEIKTLEAKLVENPYDYSTHVALINKLQDLDERYFARLKTARQEMSSKYPLSSELWLPWLRDEISLVKTQADRDAVTELCEKATKDYLCTLRP